MYDRKYSTEKGTLQVLYTSTQYEYSALQTWLICCTVLSISSISLLCPYWSLSAHFSSADIFFYRCFLFTCFLFLFDSLSISLAYSILQPFSILIMSPSTEFVKSGSPMNTASWRKIAAWKSKPSLYFMKSRIAGQWMWAQRQSSAKTWPIPTSFKVLFIAFI